jgi:hypothetical protein
LPLTVTDQ